MKIIRKEESREQCTEAGWYAYDYQLEQELKKEHILQFRELGGDFIYLTSLQHPFFKVEDHYFMIKGVEGKDVVRLSVYKAYEQELCENVEVFFNGLG